MKIITDSKSLDEIVSSNDLVDVASTLKNEFAISTTQELEKAIKEIDREGRVLKIGIVGRVKAGKSSLLNALIFDGENVLPKAATPMTAALTILEYADETKAEVDFFTQEDVDDIKTDYDEYLRQLERLTDSKYKQLLERESKKKIKQPSTPVGVDDSALQERAKSQAERELKGNDKLRSAYDQYNRIKNAGVTVNDLSDFEEISANNTQELNEKLYDFVGANGKYMPFTKSVTLKLKEESLKDVQIIDTPGVNDPVVSREERTKELLKYCDVVLIVSPAGQFLSSEDLDLFDRITSKEGVKEVYIVASQVDLQLFGSEKEQGNGIPSEVLKKISINLTQQMQSVFKSDDYLKDSPTFKKLLESSVIHSSGIAHSLLKKFDDQNTWDDNEKHVWKMLSGHYKDYFESKESALANLEQLANIKQIKIILDKVKQRKDQILKQKKDDFVATRISNLNNYKSALTQHIKDKKQRLQDADLEQITQQKSQMEAIKGKASRAVNNEYNDIVDHLEIDLKELLNNKLNSYFKSSKKEVRESEGTETKSREKYVGRGGFLWLTKKYETVHWDISTVKAGHIRNSLEDLTGDIEYVIDTDSKKHLLDWRKELFKKIVSTLRQEAGDENLEIGLISQTIRNVLHSVVYPEISYSNNLPKSLKKGGTLKEEEAEEFITDAQNYISQLKSTVKDDIKKYLKQLVDALNTMDVSETIFTGYQAEIEELENDIRNKQLSLEKYNKIITQLEEVA